MREYVILGGVIIICLFLGFIFGRFGMKKHHDGSVVLETTEDGERDRIRFVLDMDLDALKDKSQLTLKVENNLSQNQQAV